MSYKVIIKNNETGEERVRDEDLEWFDHSLFWWTEGNFGCDCNRYLEFERAAGNEPDWDEGVCGNSKFTVPYALFPNGETIKIDD